MMRNITILLLLVVFTVGCGKDDNQPQPETTVLPPITHSKEKVLAFYLDSTHYNQSGVWKPSTMNPYVPEEVIIVNKSFGMWGERGETEATYISKAEVTDSTLMIRTFKNHYYTRIKVDSTHEIWEIDNAQRYYVTYNLTPALSDPLVYNIDSIIGYTDQTKGYVEANAGEYVILNADSTWCFQSIAATGQVSIFESMVITSQTITMNGVRVFEDREIRKDGTEKWTQPTFSGFYHVVRKL